MHGLIEETVPGQIYKVSMQLESRTADTDGKVAVYWNGHYVGSAEVPAGQPAEVVFHVVGIGGWAYLNVEEDGVDQVELKAITMDPDDVAPGDMITLPIQDADAPAYRADLAPIAMGTPGDAAVDVELEVEETATNPSEGSEDPTSDDPSAPHPTAGADAGEDPHRGTDSDLYFELLTRSDGEEGGETPGAPDEAPPEDEPGEPALELPAWHMTDAHDGWTANQGQVEVWRDFIVKGIDEVQYEIDADVGVDEISKSFETLADKTYKVSFALSQRPGVSVDSSHVSVYWNGELMGTVAPTEAGWNNFEFHVTGDGEPGRLTFSDVEEQSDSYGAILDAVRVVADDVAPKDMKTLLSLSSSEPQPAPSWYRPWQEGTSGDDLLTGSAGREQFWFVAGDVRSKEPIDFGHDTIMNFEEGDVLGFWDLASIDELTIRNLGDDTLIARGNSSILIKNYQSDSWADQIELHEDFLITLDPIELEAVPIDIEVNRMINDPLSLI